MRGWQYRIVRKDGYYYMHECFLDKDGKPSSITEEPVTVFSEDPGGCEWVLKRMLESLSKPFLDYYEFIEKG